MAPQSQICQAVGKSCRAGGHNTIREIEMTTARARHISCGRMMQVTSIPLVNSTRRGFSALIVLAACAFLLSNAFGQDQKAGEARPLKGLVHGVVTRIDTQGQSTPMAGTSVKLSDTARRRAPQSTLADDDGNYQFTELDPGAYLVEVNLKGFQPFSQEVALQQNESQVVNIGLTLETVALSVDVQGEAENVTAHSSDPDARLTENKFPDLPIPEQQVKEALPLMPGVVRTMDGILNFKGESENEGMLLVDSAQMVDPVTGGFAIAIPLPAVQSLNVYESPYNAEYGGFSGGLTTIETKAPPDKWQYSLMDFVPGLRAKSGHIAGVSADTPKLYTGGPLIKNKLNISETIDYIVKNRPIRGLAWPNNEVRKRAFTSFTSLQAILSEKHLLTASVVAFSARTQFEDINSFVPQSASSNSGSKGASVSVNDTYQLASGTLGTMFRYTRFDSNAYGQGPQDMFITLENWGGNYFNQWAREANQVEVLPTFRLARKNWHGSHDLKVGVDVVHRWFSGRSQTRPIHILRGDGSLAERVDFRGTGLMDGADTESSGFVQDHWAPTDRLGVDAGLRLISQSNGRASTVAPRLGLAYSLGSDRKTVLRAGSGIFYDRVSMLASGFTQYPMKVVSLYDQAGLPVGAPIVYRNVYLDGADRHSTVEDSHSLGTSPRNFTWNLGLERELRRNVTARASYLQSETSNVFIAGPWAETASADPVLALSHSGNSHYREFQGTIRVQLSKQNEASVSYIRSKARGDLNTVSSLFAPFAQPIIRPNVNAYLDSDIPNRMLASGLFHLPWSLTVSPMIDLHTGYRYSAVDELQNYVGTPNSHRFPTFFSLNMKIYKDFPVPAFIGPLKNRQLRAGVYAQNFTNHLNPHDVYNNVASSEYGNFVGYQHRVYGLLVDLIKRGQ